MPDSFEQCLDQVLRGESLGFEPTQQVMTRVMSGQCSDEQIAQLLTGLAEKGETVEEVAGAALAMRRHMTPIRSRHDRLLDTCGTGGGGSQIFNVSTTAAIVVAAAGVPVAKHGNRSITSRSGSADVLAELGVNVEASVPQVERCLDELGVCFCFAPLMHPAMRHVAAVRKQLGIRTIFNLLGPLSNPAGATRQLLGAGRPELRPLLASALKLLGVERAIVVSGADGLGEVTLADVTRASIVVEGSENEQTLQPEDFGVARQSLDPLVVSGPSQSAAMVRAAISGAPGPQRDIVLLNAAAGLLAAAAHETPAGAAEAVAEAIDSGAAAALLARLAEMSHQRE